MGYRGQDIDLRTPQTWSATPADIAGTAHGVNGPRGRGYESTRGGPIWVDDTLLACCNHAFDVALAHRSSEVRLEHLLYALTRIEAAVESLEARGIRVAGLRRESATIVASEIPVGLANGKSSPRRSVEMEEALRLAAQHAYRRNAPASVDDLVHVFLDLRPDLPGLALLERHAGLAGRETPQTIALRSRPYGPELDYAEPPVRERVRRPAGRFYVNEIEAERDLGATTTDQIQNSRIEALEQLVRALGGQISGARDESSRYSLGMDERLQSIERLVASSTGPQLSDRLASMERSLESRLADATQAVSTFLDRLDRLDQSGAPAELSAIDKRLGQLEARLDLEPLSNRLAIIEEAVLALDTAADTGIGERLLALEEAERAHRTEIYETHAALTGEIKAATGAIAAETQRAATRHGETVGAFEGLAERLVSLDRQLTESTKKWSEVHAAYGEDLKELHEALMKLNSNQHTLAGSIDQWRLDASGDVSVVSNRLAAMETEIGRPTRMLEELSAKLESLSGNIQMMHRLIVQRYHRRNRFWYWLFGTDDWVAASWPSQAARIEAELEAMKPAARR